MYKQTMRRTVALCILSATVWTGCGDDGSSEDNSLRLEDFTITVNENPKTDTLLGKLAGNTNFPDLAYSIQSEEPQGALNIDETTGELRVADASLWDYETNPTIRAVAIATAGEEAATADITVTLNDVGNELNVGTNGLIARYTFDNTLADAQGNFPDFQFAGDGNNPRSIMDRDGNTQKAYIIENGSKYLKLASQDLLLDTDKTFTIAIWIYPQGPLQDMRPVIYKEFDYELQVSPGQFLDGTNFFCTVKHGTPSDTDAWGTNARIRQLNAPRRVQWSHLAMVCDTDEVRVYINGVKRYDAEITADSFKNSGNALLIGAIEGTGGTVTEKNIVTVDDFRYYNQALTDSQIKELAEVNVLLP